MIKKLQQSFKAIKMQQCLHCMPKTVKCPWRTDFLGAIMHATKDINERILDQSTFFID